MLRLLPAKRKDNIVACREGKKFVDYKEGMIISLPTKKER